MTRCQQCGAEHAGEDGDSSRPCPRCGHVQGASADVFLPELSDRLPDSLPNAPEPPRPAGHWTGPAMQPARFLRDRRRPHRARTGILIAIGVLAVGGAAGIAAWVRHRNERPLPAPFLDNVLARWRLSFPELEGTAVEHLRQGEEALAADAAESDRVAEQAFQQALLLDPQSDAAIAGYARAVALGRGPEVDTETFDEAMALLAAAEIRSRRAPAVLLAEAFLLMCRPEDGARVPRARALAEEALAKGPPALRSSAQLALGRALASRSAQLAIQAFNAALDLDPHLHRAYRERAHAKALNGDFEGALADLEAGLTMAPGHWETLRQLADLKAQLGDTAGARALYEKAAQANPRQLRPRLAMAVLSYQEEGRPQDAVAELKALLTNPDALEDAEAAEAFTHLAAAERAAQLPGAEEAARTALTRVPTDPAAHLQLLFILLAKGERGELAGHAASLQGRLADRALELLLSGMAEWFQGKPNSALPFFQTAVSLDERRSDAAIWSVVAQGRLGRREAALDQMERVAQLDPDNPGPIPENPRWFVLPGDTLRGASGQLVALRSAETDLRPMLDEAVVRYRLGELKEAKKWVDEMLRIDDNFAPALALKALISLRENPASCRPDAERAVRAQAHLALAQYALGRCLASLHEDVGAQRALAEAVALAPGMASAQLALAQLEPLESAKARLLRLLERDASFRPAKRVLYARLRSGGTR